MQISFLNNSFSWSLKFFNSLVFSYKGLSEDRCQVNYVLRFRNEFEFFSLINYFLRNNWLIKYFSLRSIKVFNNNFFGVNSWLSLFRVFECLSLLLFDIDILLSYIFNRLNIFFSISYLSGNLNRNLVDNLFIVNNGLVLNSFSIYRSSYFFLSNNWSLHNSLFDNRLRNDSLGDNRLSNHLSFNLWLANNLLTLSNLWSRIKNLIT